MRTSLLTVTGALALALLAGCTVKEVEPPSLAGPSTLAQSLIISAVPDSILQDQSSSTIVVLARGPNGQGIDGLRLRAQVFVNDVALDFGTLAPKETITGGGTTRGEARFVYTAPSRPVESVGIGTRVTIRVTPVGTDSGNLTPSDVHVNVIPPGVILPPNGAPVAAFSVSPSGLTRGVTATFDASTSTDEGVVCGSACAYRWNFGDGSTGSGMLTTHQYRSSGSFPVILTVTDIRGMSGSATQTLSVAAAAAPTAAFVFSPSSPARGQTIFFNASTSRPATNRSIVSYDWDFGDGRSASGLTATKIYDSNGAFVVVLTVKDDVNEIGTSTQTITISNVTGAPTAVLDVSPTATITTATQVNFDAARSTPGASPIAKYGFNWGDGTTTNLLAPDARTSHHFSAPGTYIVRLTVEDTQGRTASVTVTVTVN